MEGVIGPVLSSIESCPVLDADINVLETDPVHQNAQNRPFWPKKRRFLIGNPTPKSICVYNTNS